MTGSVESTKGVAKDAETKPDTAKSTPEDLLKQAVAGKGEAKGAEIAKTEPAAAAAAPVRRMPSLRLDARLAAVATVALVVGTAFGMVSAPRERSGEALARIDADLEAGHTEANRLNSEIERLTKTLAALRDSTEGARGEVKGLGSSLADRMTRLEQGLDKKIAALGQRIAQPEREAAAIGTPAPQVEKRPAVPVAALPTTSAAVAASTPKAEPTQTASITEAKVETKLKTETVEAWALREVYDGIAMLEDRKRRLLEVMPGESVPGVGRVEAIERRGKSWVVVTKQGLITPQMW